MIKTDTYSSWMTTVVAVLAGACSGLCAAFFSAPAEPAAATEQVAALPTSPHAVDGAQAFAAQIDSEALERLKSRVAALELSERSERDATRETQAPRQDEDPLGEAARREQVISEFQAHLLAHEQEARAPAWAAKAERLFDADLADLADGGGFAVTDTQCRSSTCSTEIEWPSYGAAVQGYAALLHGDYDLECERTIVLADEVDEDSAAKPYRATLLFECSPGAG